MDASAANGTAPSSNTTTTTTHTSTTGNTYTIRPLTAADYDATCKLILEVQQEHLSDLLKLFDSSPNDLPQLDLQQEFHRHPLSNFWVAVEDSSAEIAGTVGLTYLEQSKTIMLRKMYVSSRHQRQGLGQALWQQALNWIKQHHIHNVYCDTAVSLVGAQKLYVRQGFKYIDRSEVPEGYLHPPEEFNDYLRYLKLELP